MSAKRGATGLSGVLVIDKPIGCTSHDVVNRVRRATGERRVGHAGTLDPAASGVLLVLVGPYTRLEPYLSAKDKRYEAVIRFGCETDTDDAEGAVTRHAAVSADVLDAEYAQGLLDTFSGDSMQSPPAYSAIKVGGQVAYKAARKGDSLELAARPITVLDATLLAIDSGDETTWAVDFTVSKGTYIRALARDIGRATGGAAHLSGLRRTAVGPVGVECAVSLDDVEAAAAAGAIESLFADAIELVGLPALQVESAAIANGRPLSAPPDRHPQYAIVVAGRLAAIYRSEGDILRAEAVFPTLMGATE